MSTIVTRAGKGSPLTNNEMDANLNNLNNDKLEPANIHSATSKTTPVDADEIALIDSAASFGLKKLTWANIKSTIFSAWGALINGGTAKTAPVGTDAIAIMDSEASNATKKLTFSNLKVWLLSFMSANVASSATVDLTGSFGKTVHITGTTTISAFTMTAGQVMDLIFDGVLTLTHHATNNNLPGGANIATAANDRARYFYDGTTIWCLQYQKADGTAVVATNALPSQTGNAGKFLKTNGSAASWDEVISLSAVQATTSGTYKDFAIPAGAKEITLKLFGVSINGTSGIAAQFGDSGGIEPTGYSASCSVTSSALGTPTFSSTRFPITATISASEIYYGSITFSRLDSGAYSWVSQGVLSRDGSAAIHTSSGGKTTSAEVTTLRLTTVNDTDAFDAGSASVTIKV